MLSTNNLPEEKVFSQKALQPGNHVVRIFNLELTVNTNRPNALDLSVHLLGPKMPEGFVGFPIDSTKPEGPKFQGQTAKVKYQPFSFEDKTLDNGTKFERDTDILRALDKLADAVGVKPEVDKIQAATIQEFFTKARPVILNKAKTVFLDVCLGGNESVNKKGFKVVYPYFLTPKDGMVSFAAVGNEAAKVFKFDPEAHIYRPKAKPVESFAPAPSAFDDAPAHPEDDVFNAPAQQEASDFPVGF